MLAQTQKGQILNEKDLKDAEDLRISILAALRNFDGKYQAILLASINDIIKDVLIKANSQVKGVISMWSEDEYENKPGDEEPEEPKYYDDDGNLLPF